MGIRRANCDHFRAAFDRTKGEAIFFLHIGKNAGTQVRQLCEQVQAKGHAEFVRVRHGDKFSVLPDGARYFFSVRSPSARFKSGFYSRKRKGAPRLYNEWSAHEAEAFAHFEHASDLAESLFEETTRGRLAWAAAQSITHTAMQQSDWFSQYGFALELHPPIWIIRQEHFNADFDKLLERAGIALRLADLSIAQDQKLAHSTDYTATPELSAKAQNNLERWYARDFAFYNLCCDWIEHQH
ncbi:sulfotransferase family 2 domain-containing protein [Altererythrobacter lutimaris]|uniref:sulfotransferase family 2 domain-containing protein n=1 Tax=Altererythrobacter lutimaris TaxID=2743979 RepID=UPI001594D442|nr:sulfotransferase family 2 domain-containing protein [Altererythrobacter lutimaris]